MTTYKYNVKLDSVVKAKNFVDMISQKEGTFEIVVGQYVVNAKSIMGLFCLDLTKTLELRAEQELVPQEIEAFIA